MRETTESLDEYKMFAGIKQPMLNVIYHFCILSFAAKKPAIKGTGETKPLVSGNQK